MKKTLFPVIIALSISSLLGCSSGSKNRLTYGTLYHESSISLDNASIYSKKDNENLLLATYGDTTCGCWVYFSRVLDALAKNYHILTYKLDNKEIDDRLNAFGIKNSNDPAFYIIAEGKIVKRYYYTDDNSFFADENKLLEEITNNINLPYMYFVNDDQLEERRKQESIIYYLRSTCPDCSYCTPHVLMPYLKDKNLNDKIYVYDMDPIRKEDPETYQAFKDDHYLSNKYSLEYGYGTGYVPTFQYYKDNMLIDMAVYFNDEIADGVITKSYYDNERANNLHYLDKLTKKVLTGTTLSADELSSTGHWASQAIQNKYYQPFLEAFLDTYVK